MRDIPDPHCSEGLSNQGLLLAERTGRGGDPSLLLSAEGTSGPGEKQCAGCESAWVQSCCLGADGSWRTLSVPISSLENHPGRVRADPIFVRNAPRMAAAGDGQPLYKILGGWLTPPIARDGPSTTTNQSAGHYWPRRSPNARPWHSHSPFRNLCPAVFTCSDVVCRLNPIIICASS